VKGLPSSSSAPPLMHLLEHEQCRKNPKSHRS
jgi:hypothetical protein